MMKRKNMLQRLTAVLAVMLFMAAPAQAQPKAEFLNPRHHFGEISHKQPKVSHQYWLVNAGDEPLVLYGYGRLCSCIHPVYSSKPVMPGKATLVYVEYDATGQEPGEFIRSIHIHSNDPRGTLVLVLGGEVLDD